MSVLKLSAVCSRIFAQLRILSLVPDVAPRDYPFVPGDVAQFQRVSADLAAAAIDDPTWKDMLIEEYAAQLSVETSIFGRQILHRRLRAGLGDADSDALGERLSVLMADPNQLDEMHQACCSLRNAEREIAGLLFEEERPAAPRWVGRTWQLPLALLGSIVAASWSPLAWLLTGLVLYLLISTQMRYSDRLEVWAGKMNSLQMLLRTSSLLGTRKHVLLAHVAAKRAQVGKLNRSLTRSPMLAAMPGARGYSDWFMLGNVKHYFDSIAIVFENREFLRQCYLDVANIEADFALARHLLQTSVWCRAARRSDPGLMLEQAVHPLLVDAAPLSMELQGLGAFISGQNGIGKSTLLRTVGLNLLAARAFGFCYAQRASLPTLPVYASMQSEDSLLGGESLYMAELRRAQELLAAANGPHPGIYIFDEIFRGTNHLESVSAAASVLDLLAEKGLVIVSSHNLMLGALLAHRLTPLCVTAPGGDKRRLLLVPGVLEATNGIALLAAHGFDAAISAKAGRVFEWLGAYLAHPADCREVLRPA